MQNLPDILQLLLIYFFLHEKLIFLLISHLLLVLQIIQKDLWNAWLLYRALMTCYIFKHLNILKSILGLSEVNGSCLFGFIVMYFNVAVTLDFIFGVWFSLTGVCWYILTLNQILLSRIPWKMWFSLKLGFSPWRSSSDLVFREITDTAFFRCFLPLLFSLDPILSLNRRKLSFGFCNPWQDSIGLGLSKLLLRFPPGQELSSSTIWLQLIWKDELVKRPIQFFVHFGLSYGIFTWTHLP